MNKKPSRTVRWFTKITGAPGAWIFFRTKVYYYSEKCSRRLPRPCIIISNHRSLLDFVLYEALFPFRNIRFLMAEVLFTKNPLFSWFLYKLGGIYVNRDAYDFSFVGEALETLDNGGTVGIFPEGRLPVNGVPFPFLPSAAFIGVKTDAPIIPVYTDGKYGSLSRTRVMIGEPIYLKDHSASEQPDEAELKRLTEILHGKVYELGEELKRRQENEKSKTV